MGRPKGAKNKTKTLDPAGGNPDFNLNSVTPSQTIGEDIAATAPLPEDFELDRELDRLAAETAPAGNIGPDPTKPMTKEAKSHLHLRDFVENYTPASTVNELMDQVHVAKELDCDSIDGTEQIIRHYCRKAYPTEVGYFVFHDIKVHIPNKFEEAKTRDLMTMEQKVFGKAKSL